MQGLGEFANKKTLHCFLISRCRNCCCWTFRLDREIYVNFQYLCFAWFDQKYCFESQFSFPRWHHGMISPSSSFSSSTGGWSAARGLAAGVAALREGPLASAALVMVDPWTNRVSKGSGPGTAVTWSVSMSRNVYYVVNYANNNNKAAE